MKTLYEIQREARARVETIRELEGLTPRFLSACERTEAEFKLHVAKIEGERGHLSELRDAAALIVQHLGEDVPEAEPVVAVADSPQDWSADFDDVAHYQAGKVLNEVYGTSDAWAAADHAISDIALVSELFEEGPHEGEPVLVENTGQLSDWLADACALDGPKVYERTEVEIDPTFEYVAEAVAQIASPPPPAPDATDEPELTDEQVERIEERLATPDPITAAEADPERELETVSAYVNVHPRTKWPWMGS